VVEVSDCTRSRDVVDALLDEKLHQRFALAVASQGDVLLGAGKAADSMVSRRQVLVKTILDKSDLRLPATSPTWLKP